MKTIGTTTIPYEPLTIIRRVSNLPIDRINGQSSASTSMVMEDNIPDEHRDRCVMLLFSPIIYTNVSDTKVSESWCGRN